MTDTPTITNARGTQLPNPKALGFEWRAVQVLLEQHAALRSRGREIAGERRELQEEMRRLERDHERARAEALRAGKEAPGREGIEHAKRRYEALGEQERDVRRAADLIDSDLYAVVAEHAPEWDEDVRREAARLLEEAHEAAGELREKLYRADLLVAVHEWLESRGERFAVNHGAGVPVEGLIEQRRRAVGLVRSEVISTTGAPS